MYRLFQNVLSVSLFITPVILLLLFLMPRLGRKYAPRLRYLVWIVATLRLLIPVNFSLRDIFHGLAPVANLLDQIDQNAVIDTLLGVLSDESVSVGTTAGQAIATPIINISFCTIVWLVGMILFLGYNIIAYYLTVKRLQRWSALVTEPFLTKTFADMKKSLSVSGDIKLYQTTRTSIPMLVGFVHPHIYLPNKHIDASELADILSHELCHYKRKDLWFKLTLLFVNAIHWFNPAVYLMLRQAELDMEMACDSDVLRGASPYIRKQYGLTILSFVEQTQVISTPLTTYFYGGKKQMRLRFSDIINKNGKKSGIVFLSVFALLIVFCGAWVGNDVFAASPAKEIAPKEIEMESGELPISHGNGEMAWPVPNFYSITSAYGLRYGGTDIHTGIDIAEEGIYGASVIAAEDGTVIHVVTDYQQGIGYGMYVIIDHGGDVSTLYGHLSAIIVNVGDKVEKGQPIAKVGSTGFSAGPHLQFEVRESGIAVDPVTYLMPTEE